METKTCLRKGSGAPIQRMHGGGISPRQFGELSLKFAGFTGISTGYERRPENPLTWGDFTPLSGEGGYSFKLLL
ncbi:MAG: hypothetical protein ACUZ8N_11965 [Candidatus Scalindua sp.]